MKASNWREKERGFTLIEMMIVLFVISVLLILLLPNFTETGARAQQKTCDANIKLLQGVSEAYSLEQGVVPDDVGDLASAGYISQTPICPLQPSETDAYRIDAQGQVSCQYHQNATS